MYLKRKTVNPDIAKVAADKAALVDATIKGTNTDLTHLTAALTSPLLATGSVNGSSITWASSVPGIVSNDGQKVIRPTFGAGDATVTLTATITKGIITDTKVFTIIVLKHEAPPSGGGPNPPVVPVEPKLHLL